MKDSEDEIRMLALSINRLCYGETRDSHILIHSQLVALASVVVMAALPNQEFSAIEDTIKHLRACCLYFLNEMLAGRIEKQERPDVH